MDKVRVNIVIIEPSQIIYEGLVHILMRYKKHFYFYRIGDLDELKALLGKEKFDVAIINPSAVQNRVAEFVKLKNNYSGLTCVALLYAFFEDDLLRKFDETLSVTASVNEIVRHIGQIGQTEEKAVHEDLSDREIEVLTQMVKGLANKEIADKLNISVHTVISHRKNITDKTGIKSLSGLTIYSITKRIIPLDYNSI